MGLDSEVKYQYLAGICVNIISVSYGAFCGWPSASFLTLESDDSPLESGPMSKYDAGWVGAMVCLGGALGTICFAWCADRFGRKRSLMLVAIPSLIGWLLIPFAKNPIHLCISRLFGGFAGGGVFGLVPMYLTEVADNRIRGTLGTFLIFSCNIGVLFAFVLGYYYSYSTVAWILAIPSIIFLLTFVFLPETPQHLLRQNKIGEAEKSFRYYRNIRSAVPELSENLKSELQKLKSDEKLDTEVTGSVAVITWNDFTTQTARKALFIGVALVSLNQFSGLFVMLNYTATIFRESGSNLTPNMAAIVVGAIQIVGSYMSTVLVERTGRKLLLVTSAVGTALGEICLGTYTFLSIMGYEVEQYNWIPIASFSFTIFIACWGVLPLPFLIVTEIMPPKIRNIGTMICMLFLWTFAFILLKSFPVLISVVKMHGLMFFFSGYCLASAVFVIFFVPETKGKSLEAILSLL